MRRSAMIRPAMRKFCGAPASSSSLAPVNVSIISEAVCVGLKSFGYTTEPAALSLASFCLRTSTCSTEVFAGIGIVLSHFCSRVRIKRCAPACENRRSRRNGSQAQVFADRADGIGFVQRIEVKSLDAELDQFLALAGGIFDPDLHRRFVVGFHLGQLTSLISPESWPQHNAVKRRTCDADNIGKTPGTIGTPQAKFSQIFGEAIIVIVIKK